MSQRNVEIVRATLDSFNRGDFVATLKDLAPQAELDFSRARGPYRGVYRLEQVREFIEDFTATFESVRIEPTEYMVAGEHVVVPVVFHSSGRDGVKATAGSVHVWTLSEGAIVRLCMYQGREEALEAAGLSS